MTVEKILKEKGGEIVSVEPGDTIASAAAILRERRIGALLVCKNGQMRGIVSERDMVQALAEGADGLGDRPVSDIMTGKVERCTRDEPISAIFERMERGRFRHMPVFDGDELIGLVSITDIARRRAREAEREVESARDYMMGSVA